MAYTQKTWKNRQSEHPNRRVLTPTGNPDEYDVVRSEGVVAEEGDLLDANNLNDLERRIKAGFDEKADKGEAFATYTHVKSGTVHNLVGTGNNIKFLSTARWNPGDSLTINGTPCKCWNQNGVRVENENLFANNVFVTIVIGTSANGYSCFFKSGGGVSNTKLAQATATAADVRKGKTFFAGDKELKTGAGGVGATGTFNSLYNDTIEIDVGFEPQRILLTYDYNSDTHIVLVFDASNPDTYYIRSAFKNGIDYPACNNEDGSIYGYIKLTESGFTFKGYYGGSGNQLVYYMCY